MYPMYWLLIINLVVSSANFLYEITSIFRLGLSKHFESYSNYLDFFGQLSGLLWLNFMLMMNLECDKSRDDIRMTCTYE